MKHRSDPAPYAGALGPCLASFRVRLAELGYTKSGIEKSLCEIADLGGWLWERDLSLRALGEEPIAHFREESPTPGPGILFQLLLEHLRGLDLAPAPTLKPPSDEGERLLQQYTEYLQEQRGLAWETRKSYRRETRRFLAERFPSGSPGVSDLDAAQVREYVLSCAQAGERGRTKVVAKTLRSFLSYLYQHDEIPIALSAAVPTVPAPPASLPGSLSPEQVREMLDTCERDTVAGQRDYAILLLAARCGLRAGEMAALRLEDFDWRAGELTIRGKGGQLDRLPITPDVGEAVSTYLRDGRPRSPSQHVFLRLIPPYLGFTHASTVSCVVRRALERAGLDPPRKGVHLLRHSLAREMLRRDTSLTQIAQILRHRSTATTEIYARVDLDALRKLARPWPGGGR
jgi:integrase/recombinase XerD